MTANDRKSGIFPSNETALTHSGRASEEHLGFVNVPVFRGSTILFRTLDELEDYKRTYRYGRNDNPANRALSELVTDREGASGAVTAPAGLSAISTALLSVVSAGDEVLIADSAYEPTRTFSSEGLARLGITARYYHPRIPTAIA